MIIWEIGAEKQTTLTHRGGDKKAMLEEEDSEAVLGGDATVAARANYLSGELPWHPVRGERNMPQDAKAVERRLAGADTVGKVPEGSTTMCAVLRMARGRSCAYGL